MSWFENTDKAISYQKANEPVRPISVCGSRNDASRCSHVGWAASSVAEDHACPVPWGQRTGREECQHWLLQRSGNSRKSSKNRRATAHRGSLYLRRKSSWQKERRTTPSPPGMKRQQPLLLNSPHPPQPRKALPGRGHRPPVLTFNEKEKAYYPHGCHDGPRHDEGQAPARGHPAASDQGPQNVAHRRVGIPDPHDQTSPATQQNTRGQMMSRGLHGSGRGVTTVPARCKSWWRSKQAVRHTTPARLGTRGVYRRTVSSLTSSCIITCL